MGWTLAVWLPSFVLNRAGNKLLDSLAKSSLFTSLQDEITTWAKSLPDHMDLAPEALFPKRTKTDKTFDRPAIHKLDTDLITRQIPSEETWLAAIFEQWEEVRRNVPEGDRQKLFTISPSEAKLMFRSLSSKLYHRCVQDEQLFKGTVIELLRSREFADLTEQQLAEGLVSFLDDRHVLFAAFSNESPIGCYESARLIRSTITEIMVKVPRKSVLYTLCDGLRSPSAEFMRKVERTGLHKAEGFYGVDSNKSKEFFQGVTEYRNNVALPLKKLCAEYGIAPGAKLQQIFS